MKKSVNILLVLCIVFAFSFTSCTRCTKTTSDDGTRIEHKDGPGIGDGSPESYEEGDEGSPENNAFEGNGNSRTQRSSKHPGNVNSQGNQTNQGKSDGIFHGKTEGDTSAGESKNNARTVSPGGRGNSGMGRPY